MEYDNTTESSKIALSLEQIVQTDNIATLLSEEQLKRIGAQVVSWFDADEESRADWKTKSQNALKLAMQVVENKTFPWPNASNVKFPLLTIAALQFSARVYPTLIKAPDIVKYRVMGEDPQGAKASRAFRVAKYMSYQLLEEDEHWEESQDKLFIALPILGCVFKKTFYDPLIEKARSRIVFPDRLAVHYYAKDLERSRHTEIYDLYPTEIKERQLRKLFIEPPIDITKPGNVGSKTPRLESDKRQGISPPANDNEVTREFLECYCFWDFDADGLAEPYIVTTDKETKYPVRIVKRFKKLVSEQTIQADALAKENFLLLKSIPPPEIVQQAVQQGQLQGEQQKMLMAKIAQVQAQMERNEAQINDLLAQPPSLIRIEPKKYYTKYSFIPAPDGGFYDLGFGQLLGPINASVDTLINQLIDSGTLQNGSQGFIGKGARIKGGRVRFEPFEWKQVAVAGSTLRDSLVPLPINQPSPVLFQLIGLLIQYAERIGSSTDIMSGENPGQNTPAYNMSAMLEQGMQVFNGVFKRIYRSFRSELRRIYEINGEFLDPQTYFETLDGDFNVLQSDFTADPKDLIPAADPNAFSNVEAMTQAQFLAQRSAQVPGYNPIMVEKRLLEALNIRDFMEVFPLTAEGEYVFPPQPNPELEIEKADMQRRTLEGKVRGEIDAALAEAEITLKEAQANKLYTDMQQVGNDAAMAEIKVAQEHMKAIRESAKGKVDILLKQMDILLKQRDLELAEKKIEMEKAKPKNGQKSTSKK